MTKRKVHLLFSNDLNSTCTYSISYYFTVSLCPSVILGKPIFLYLSDLDCYIEYPYICSILCQQRMLLKVHYFVLLFAVLRGVKGSYLLSIKKVPLFFPE